MGPLKSPPYSVPPYLRTSARGVDVWTYPCVPWIRLSGRQPLLVVRVDIQGAALNSRTNRSYSSMLPGESQARCVFLRRNSLGYPRSSGICAHQL